MNYSLLVTIDNVFSSAFGKSLMMLMFVGKIEANDDRSHRGVLDKRAGGCAR